MEDQQYTPPRSIDDYLDSAYNCPSRANNGILYDIIQHWRYYIIFLALGIANSGDSAEMGCTNYILSSTSFQHDILGSDMEDGAEDGEEIDFAKRGAAIAGAHFAGMLISGLLSGILADIKGRRTTLLLGLICNSVVGVLAAASRNATELCILRFLCGVGLGMVIAGVVTLSAEISPPSKRGRFMTLVASCYTLGFLYTAFWAMVIFQRTGSGSWRLFMVINALPTMIAATLVTLFATESPRYFLCRGRLKEAVHASNLIASRIGYVDKVLTEEELRKYLSQTQRIGEASFIAKETLQASEVRTDQSLIYEIWTSLSSIKYVFVKGHWRTTVPLQMNYFCLTLVTGVATWWTKIFQLMQLQNETDPYALSFYQTLSQIPGMILASALIDYVGRRRFIMLGFGGGCASLVLLSIIASTIQNSIDQSEDSEGYSWIVLFLTCIYTICLCVCWLSLDCQTAESFPTKVRSTGSGVCKAMGRLVGFCVQFLYGPMVNDNRVGDMMRIASLFAMGGVIMGYQTTDTTNVDLQDHWDYSPVEDENSRQTQRVSLTEIKHSKYFSVDVEHNLL